VTVSTSTATLYRSVARQHHTVNGATCALADLLGNRYASRNMPGRAA
jgi:hypothetical protein